MVSPYKVQFRVLALSAFVGGPDPVRIPVRCWRFTATFSPNLGGAFTLDGVNFTKDFAADLAGTTVNTVTIRVGGVFSPDGSPLLLDQDLLVNPAGNTALGLLCFEDLVKI